MNKKGFTLIELLVTIAIVGILAAGAVTAYIGVTKKAARSEANANLESLSLLLGQYFADNGDYPVDLGTCAADNPGNIGDIQDGEGDAREALPRFLPGNNTSYSYCIEQNIDLNDAAQIPCFKASAFGNTNTRVVGDEFMIDCNNNRRETD